MDQRSKKIILSGRKWTVKFEPIKGAWGICTPAKKQITLHPDCEKEDNLREVFMHEFTHGHMWYLDEDCVKLFAKELDDALEIMGL